MVPQGPTHATNYRNTPALNYSICNRYKHCSFSLFTLNESGPLSCCDGIESKQLPERTVLMITIANGARKLLFPVVPE